MNILWLSHNVPYPPVSGALQRNYNLLKRVAARHNVYLLAFNQKALLSDEKEIQEAQQVLEKLCSHVEIVSIPSDSSRFCWYKLVLASFFSKDPYAINWLKSQEMHSRIKHALGELKFDLVHYDTIGLVEYFNDVGCIAKVLNHHNVESVMMKRRASKETNILKQLYFYAEAVKLKSAEKEFCAQAKVNLVVSNPDAAELREICPQANVALCENGCDTDYLQPSETELPEPGHLLFIGNLKWYPNRDAIVYFIKEVWPELVKECPLVKLTVVGAHPPEELVRLASRDARLQVTGFVEDMRPYFRRADIVICPIRDGGGTRLKILDAMAMGKPIVTTSIGCEGIDVVPGRDVFIAETARDFIAHIKSLMANPSMKAEVSSSVRKIAERKYSWDVIGNRLLTIYSEVDSDKF